MGYNRLLPPVSRGRSRPQSRITHQMSSMKFARALAAVVIPLSLGACDTIKGTYNALTGSGAADDSSLTSASIDDVRRPPLTLPPDFNLRPPSATGAGATDITAAQQGRQTVFGLDQQKPGAGGVERSGGASSGEAALLQHAGASAASNSIRQKVDRESNALQHQEDTFVNNLLNPSDSSAAGKSSDSGWFSGIFGDSSKPSIER